MAFFKTILAVLFRTFGLYPRFLSVKPSFLYDHLTTQHSDFSIVLGISLTEKPVDRNTCFCSHVDKCFFSLRGFIFQDIHTKQDRSSNISGYKMQKNIWPENLLAQRTFGAKLHKSNFESKDGTRSMKY